MKLLCITAVINKGKVKSKQRDTHYSPLHSVVGGLGGGRGREGLIVTCLGDKKVKK